jgi:hypothetical protein
LEKQWFEPPTRVDASYGCSKAVRIQHPKIHINGKKTLKANVEWALCGD